jgi:MFS superfamily sulfate permease-like transporter
MESFKQVIKKELKTYTFASFIPIVGWIGRYNLEFAISDLIAGLTVGMVIVPFVYLF